MNAIQIATLLVLAMSVVTLFTGLYALKNRSR